jgi:hypothetical protein
MTEEVQIIESTTGIEVFEAQERAAVDIQIATAKRFPRDLKRCRDNSIVIVTMDKRTAETCRYAKPVAGKNITGPSIHLARITCQQYGNMRVQKRIKQITDRVIVAEAVAFDLENNYASCVEARRSIVGKNGQRYAESVIETNAMAILSIAERNAILNVIPKSITDAVYDAAVNTITGDLSSEEKMLKKRNAIIEGFRDKYGVTEEQLVDVLGLNSVNQIKQDQIVDLIAMAQSLKDGEITVAEMFSGTRKAEKDKADKNMNDLAEKLNQVKAKKEESKGVTVKEEPLKKMPFDTRKDALEFFVGELGIVPEALEGQKLYDTAKQLGVEAIIKNDK